MAQFVRGLSRGFGALRSAPFTRIGLSTGSKQILVFEDYHQA